MNRVMRAHRQQFPHRSNQLRLQPLLSTGPWHMTTTNLIRWRALQLARTGSHTDCRSIERAPFVKGHRNAHEGLSYASELRTRRRHG